jgi:hypothetical protein
MGALFGTRPVGAVTVVEPPVLLSYARKARIAFLSTAAVSGVSTAAVLAVFANPLWAVVLGIVAGAVCGFVVGVLVRVWPVLRVLWWWSFEIAAVAGVVLVPAWLARGALPWPVLMSTPAMVAVDIGVPYPWLALVGVAALAATAGAVGPVRRHLAAWSWCLVVRHRLRVCFAQFLRAATRTHPGSLPLILWARPTPAGERVWLWLRPGLSLEDLDGKAGKLAVTCWAGEVRVVRASTRYAALLRIDIARRDPLSDKVQSPLAKLIPLKRKATHDAVQPAMVGLPAVGLDLADVPEPAVEPRGGRR